MAASLLIAVALAVPTAPAAAEAPEATFRQAVEDFEFGEHKSAADKLRTILEPVTLADREDVIVARQYLGACYHLLGQKDRAATQFSLLLALDPEHRIDPEVFSPAIVAFFDQVRDEAVPALRDKSPAKVAPPPPPKSLPPPRIVEVRRSKEKYPAVLGLIPFGVGQFFNYHPVRGTLFALAEIGLLSAAGVSFSMFQSHRDEKGMPGPDGGIQFMNPRDADRATRLQTTYIATFWTGVAIAAIGIIEALISYPGDAVTVPTGTTASATAKAGGFTF